MTSNYRRCAETDPATDPFRQIVAAHELGHVVVLQAAEITIDYVQLDGHGPDTWGVTHANDTDFATAINHAYRARVVVAAALAGPIAAARWWQDRGPAEVEGFGYRKDQCINDMRLFDRYRDHPHVRGFSRRELRIEARCLVGAHWPRIVRLAPVLARRGQLSL